MLLSRVIKVTAVASSMAAIFAGVAQAEEVAAVPVSQGIIDTVLAGLPIAPSLLFFAAGILGLAVLSRRRGRKAHSLY